MPSGDQKFTRTLESPRVLRRPLQNEPPSSAFWRSSSTFYPQSPRRSSIRFRTPFRALSVLPLCLLAASALPPLRALPATRIVPRSTHPHPAPPAQPFPTTSSLPPATASPLRIAIPGGLLAIALACALGFRRTRLRAAATKQLTAELTRQHNLNHHLQQQVDDLTRKRAELTRQVASLTQKLTVHEARSAERLAARKKAAEQEIPPEIPQEIPDDGSTAHNAQLHAIAHSSLSANLLLNKEERLVFSAALRVLKTWNDTGLHPRLSVAPQVSLGEFLKTEYTSDLPADHPDTRAVHAIICKRVDLLIYSSSDFRPVLAIEHQGNGHFQGDWKRRDAIKRAALTRAGIALLETRSQRDTVPPCPTTPAYLEFLRAAITAALSAPSNTADATSPPQPA